MKLPKDKLKWVAAAFALVATASAEYSLARAIGMNEWIAAAVPGALDAYAVRALRAHREVLTAVLAMVGVNAASHLVTAGVLPVSWPLITAVSAIAPLVLWRVHALSTPGEHRRRVLWDVPEPLADVPPGPEVVFTVPEPEEDAFLPARIEADDLPERGPVAEVLTLPTGYERKERPVRTHLDSESVQERFWSQASVPDPDTGCMTWRGTKNHEGYGKFSVAGNGRRAHRVAYEIAEGPIAEGLVLDHLCRNKSCVRPAHLEPVTHGENVRRGWQARKEQGPVVRRERSETRPFPDLMVQARETFPAGLPTVREIKERMRVGTRNAQKIRVALQDGSTP